MDNEKWTCRYYYGNKRCTVNMPPQVKIGKFGAEFDTEEEAKEFYARSLKAHAKNLVCNISGFDSSKLMKRLEEYGQHDTIKAMLAILEIYKTM